MLHRYRLLKQADAELTRIVSRYEREREGLGFQFFESYEAAVHQAMQFPEAGSPIEHERLRQLGLQMRRFRVVGFPTTL